MPLLREALGAVLREARAERGLSLRQLAGRADQMSPTYLGEVERGLKELSSETLDRLALALGVGVAELARRAADRLDGLAIELLPAARSPEEARERQALAAEVGRQAGQLGHEDLHALARFAEFLAAGRVEHPTSTDHKTPQDHDGGA